MIALRPANGADTEFLFAVFAATYGAQLALAAAGDSLARMQFAAQDREYKTRFPAARHSIVSIDGEPAGRLLIAESDEEMRVVDVALLPRFQHRGAGTCLYSQIMSEAQAAGKPVRCSVAAGNEASLRFHRRLGFAIVDAGDMYLSLEWRPS